MTRIDRPQGAGLSREVRTTHIRTTQIRTAQITPLIRQLASLLRAGLPLAASLDVLHSGATRTDIGELCATIRRDVTEGLPLNEALARHPRCFDARCCALVAVGEASGSLAAMLGRIADEQEKSAAQWARLRASLAYPACLLVFALLITIALTWWVIPTFEDIFRSFGAPLPFATRMVIAGSRHAAVAVPLLIGACFAGYAIRRRILARSPRWRALCANHMLAIPVYGALQQRLCVARWCRALGTLLGAGVPLADAFEILAKTAGHPAYEAATRDASLRIRRGEPLSEALASNRLFPRSITGPIAVAEQTGALDTLLLDLATLADHELEGQLAALLTLVEPSIVALLGLLIGCLVVTLYLPVIELGHVV